MDRPQESEALSDEVASAEIALIEAEAVEADARHRRRKAEIALKAARRELVRAATSAGPSQADA